MGSSRLPEEEQKATFPGVFCVAVERRETSYITSMVHCARPKITAATANAAVSSFIIAVPAIVKTTQP